MKWRALIAGAALSAACVGQIGEAGAPPGVPPGPRPGGNGAACTPAALPQRVALLTNRHYANGVRDLLALAERPNIASGGGESDALFEASEGRVTGPLAFEYYQVAQRAGTSATESTSRLDALAPCAAGADPVACATRFIDRFVPRAFRRPLAADERAALVRVFDAGRQGEEGGYRGGIQLVIEAVLQSPSFLYRTELGQPAGADGRHALSPYELATQLSLFLRDTVPDEALLEAAASGRLATPEGVAAEVERLLSEPAVRANATQTVIRWLGAGHVAQVERTAPEFTPALRQSMQRETELFVDDVLWRRGGQLSELFTSRRSFVDPALARFYGVEYPAGGNGMFVPVELPAGERAGILTQPSILAALADVAETSVVRRGLFVARDLLCVHIPPPPDGAVESFREVAMTLRDERARAVYRMDHAVCGACHRNFDPFGVLFERYDELGRYRTRTHEGHAVDSSWELRAPESLAGRADDAVALAARLAQSPDVLWCTTRQMAGYAVGRPLTHDEACAAREVHERFARSGGSVVELLRAVANWPALRVRREASGP